MPWVQCIMLKGGTMVRGQESFQKNHPSIRTMLSSTSLWQTRQIPLLEQGHSASFESELELYLRTFPLGPFIYQLLQSSIIKNTQQQPE